jgi:lysophospholipase L1-like esterase
MERGRRGAVLRRLLPFAALLAGTGVVAAIAAGAIDVVGAGVDAPAATASAGGAPAVASVVPGSRYLALGDSVTFGYEEAGVVPHPKYKEAKSFVAFPEMLGRELHLTVANASCPGETTGSLITPKARSNGCESAPGAPHTGYRTKFPLHVRYKGAQLAYGLRYLKAHRDVSLVTLMIGANDGFLCVETTKDSCQSKSEMNALKQRITHNVHHILLAVRQTARYQGELVIVNYYSPFKAYDPRSKLLDSVVDAAAKPFHVQIAKGYAEFHNGDRHAARNGCTAGLLTQLGKPGACGIHPSYTGQALLAQAVEKVIRIG